MQFKPWQPLFSAAILALILQLTPSFSVQAADSPPSYRINGVPVLGEQHNLSCEYASARMMAAYWGVWLSENQFIKNIPFDPNPHRGFRGDIDGLFGGVTDYGVYAEPVASFLQSQGFETKLLAGGENALRQEIAAGRPVLVWITYALHNSWPQQVEINNQLLTLVPGEHAGVITGYDEKGVYINGPADGGRAYFEWKDFKRSWSYFGNMALSIWPRSQPPKDSSSWGVSPLFYRAFLNNGGPEIFGLPLAGESPENGKTVQYFERARLEYDPQAPVNGRLSFGLLGRELTAVRLNEGAFQSQPPSANPNERYFAASSHNIAGNFLKYWQDKGDLTLFGLPISEAFSENGKMVQYFERVRLEYDTVGNAIQVGTIGREVLTQKALRGYSLNIAKAFNTFFNYNER